MLPHGVSPPHPDRPTNDANDEAVRTTNDGAEAPALDQCGDRRLPIRSRASKPTGALVVPVVPTGTVAVPT